MKRNLIVIEIFWILSTVAFIFSRWNIVGPHGMIGIFNKIIWYILLGCIFILFSFVQKNRARFLNLLSLPFFLGLIVYNLNIGKWHNRILMPSSLIIIYIYLYYSMLHIDIQKKWKKIIRKNLIGVIALLVMPIVAISIAFLNYINSYAHAGNAPWNPTDYPRIIWFWHSLGIWAFGIFLIIVACKYRWRQIQV